MKPSLPAARFRSLCLLAAALAGCVTPPPPKEPERPTDPCALTAPAQVVLRGGEVLESRNGRVAADVWNPLAVELLPDGRIRARDPKGDPVEGFAPELEGSLAVEERGLGVFVQVETPVLVAPGGPEIGRALPGAYLPVLAMDACHARVLLRAFSPASGAGPLVAFLPVGAVGTKEVLLRPSPPPARHVRDQRRTLRSAPGVPASAFARTRCGRLEVLEAQRDEAGAEVQRVAQAEQGVELRGWVDRPIVDARGDDDCPVRLLDKKQVVAFDGEASLPEGFVRLGDGAALGKELEKLTRRDRAIFVPLVDGLGVRCEAFMLKAKGSELVRAEADKSKKQESWQVRLSGGRLGVSGPCRGGGLCAMPYLLVGLTPDRIVLLPARDDLSSRAERLLAYHQDDAEPWFLDRSACEAQAGVDHASSVLPLP